MLVQRAAAILDSPMVSTGVSVTSAPISIGASAFLFPGGTTGGVFYSLHQLLLSHYPQEVEMEHKQLQLLMILQKLEEQ